jgi:hypothetical protein
MSRGGSFDGQGFTYLRAIQISPRIEAALLILILVAFLSVSLLLIREKAPFIDDSIHIPAGYSYLLTHDFRLNQEHPPLIKLLSGLGVWATHARFPFDSPGWQQAATPRDPEDGMQKIAGAFFQMNADKFAQIVLYAKLPMLLIPLLLLLLVWWFTRQLFGSVAALIATLLTATEPNIIGNSIVVQNDVAAAFSLLLFVAALKKFLSQSRAIDALLLGTALGLGLITKYSLVPLLPACVLVVIVHWAKQLIRNNRSWIKVASQFCLIFLVAYFILISSYAFQIKRIDADVSATIASWLYLTGTSAAIFEKFLVHVPLWLPHYFIYGIDMVVQDSREGRTAFLLGRVSETGWWYYFPIAFALKTTIPFLVTSLCGFVWAVVQVFARKRYVLLYVLVPVICFLGLSMTSHMDIGVRHILPIFPLLAIASSGVICAAAQRLSQYRNALAPGFVLLLFVLPNLLISIFSYPNYLTYFSPLAGGSSAGWTKLSDSNVETGQEVKPLARYLLAHGENRVTGMLIGGEFLNYYGVGFLEFPGWDIPDEPDDEDVESDSDSHGDEPNPTAAQTTEDTSSEEVQTKYVAIGAWYFAEVDLTGKQEEIIDIYRNQKPEAMIGNSIFVFRKR